MSETQVANQSHRERHVELHKALDELVADWISHTRGLPSDATIMDLIHWSYEQTRKPTEAQP